MKNIERQDLIIHMRLIPGLILGTMAGVLIGLAATAQDLDDLLPLAKAGHAEAQNSLGDLYYYGESVPKDYGEAAKWYRMAAEQGHDEAQYELGNMYYNGVGVPQNYILAHAWVNLASANGYSDAQDLRDNRASYLTPALVVEAQKLAGCFQLGQALEECN